jgi:hypothetical protein
MPVCTQKADHQNKTRALPEGVRIACTDHVPLRGETTNGPVGRACQAHSSTFRDQVRVVVFQLALHLVDPEIPL